MFKSIGDVMSTGLTDLAEIGFAAALQGIFNTEGIDVRSGLQQLGNQVSFQIGNYLQQVGKDLIFAGGVQKLIDKAAAGLAAIGGGAGAIYAGIAAFAAGTAIKAGARNRRASISRGITSANPTNRATNQTPNTLGTFGGGTVVRPINIIIGGRLEADGDKLIAVINAAESRNVRVTGRRKLV